MKHRQYVPHVSWLLCPARCRKHASMTRIGLINYLDLMLARLWWKYRKVFLITLCLCSFIMLIFYISNSNNAIRYPSSSTKTDSLQYNYRTAWTIDDLSADKLADKRNYSENHFVASVKKNNQKIRTKTNEKTETLLLKSYAATVPHESEHKIERTERISEIDDCHFTCDVNDLHPVSKSSMQGTPLVEPKQNPMNIKGPFKHRLVHFDLKGAPPKVSYFEKILPILQQSGATGILLEYEDMFPYKGALKQIAAHNAYSREEILRILKAADALNFVVIPLIQTFGHLEFVLKLPQFRHLREDNSSSAALCPLNPKSFTLVTEIIDQVMDLHQRAKWIHIGCDEVFQMGICKKCNKYQYKKDILYLKHVTEVARYVKNSYNITPIIWDDMIRRTSSHVLKSFEIGSLVEVMVWVYAENVSELFFPRMWHRYNMVFHNVWVASAYKGAFGRELVVPNVKKHLNNHISWLSVMYNRSSSRKTQIRGLALTGWQRYEHFGPLCELLPVGIPSLVLNLLTVYHGFYDVNLLKKMKQILNCSPESGVIQSIDLDPYLEATIESCSFPGSVLFHFAQTIRRLNDSLSISLKEICDNLKNETTCHGYNTNFPRLQRCRKEIEHLSAAIIPSFSNIFNETVLTEWTAQNIDPLFNQQMVLETFRKNRTAFIMSCKNSYWSIRHRRIFPVRYVKNHLNWKNLN